MISDRFGQETLHLFRPGTAQAIIPVKVEMHMFIKRFLSQNARRTIGFQCAVGIKQIEVWTSALMALEMLAKEIAATYLQDIAEALARVGLQLYRLGEKAVARRAFKLARFYGRPRFYEAPWHFRSVARLFGPEFAENVGQIYRKLPARMRRIVSLPSVNH